MTLNHLLTARIAGIFIILASGSFAGCAGLPKTVESITVHSDPPGAQVYVSGKALGTTPLSVVLDQAFPKKWTSRIETDSEGFAFYRRLESLELKKDGCETYSRQLTSTALVKDIKVQLRCDPNYVPPATAAPQGESVEQRLQKLNELKQKGLITDDEQRDQRQRILNQL